MAVPIYCVTPNDADPNTHKFTGHERDSETGNDYMHSRYYGGNIGRFTRPDSGADFNLQSPQSWNLYSYVRGNPVNFNDPTGEVQFYVFDEKAGANNTTDYSQNNPQFQEMLQAEADVEKQTDTEAGQAAKETLAPGNDVLIKAATADESAAMGKALGVTDPKGAVTVQEAGKPDTIRWNRGPKNEPSITITLNLQRVHALKPTGESLAPAFGHELVHAKHAHDNARNYFDLHRQRDMYYQNKEEARTYRAEDNLRQQLRKNAPDKYSELAPTHRELESRAFEKSIP